MYCFTCPLHIFIPRKFSYVKVCCPGILNMYPCNLNNPVDFKIHFVTPQILWAMWSGMTHERVHFEVLHFPGFVYYLHPKVLRFLGFWCSWHPKVLQIPWLLCSPHPKVPLFPGFLCSLFPARAPEVGVSQDTHQRQTSTRGQGHRGERDTGQSHYMTLT